MKQFVYASAYGTANGNITLVETGDAKVKNLVLKRTTAEGGDILYPIYGKDLTFTVGTYSGDNLGAAYTASFTVPAVQKGLEYNVIFVKKGLGINDRSNWSFGVRSNANDSAKTIAKQIVDYVNGNSTELGLTAAVSGEGENIVTVTGAEKGQGYAVVLGEELAGLTLTETKAKPVLFDAAYVKDLANKCAADAGFEYTYDELEGLYPNREFNPFNVTGTGFKVYTIRFTEPRAVGTREESVYQVIHVAFPSNATTTSFDTALNGLK